MILDKPKALRIPGAIAVDPVHPSTMPHAALSFLDIVPAWTWFIGKIFFFLYIFIWIRATLPRYRYDQLMALGWKVLIPIAIGNLVLTAVAMVVF